MQAGPARWSPRGWGGIIGGFSVLPFRWMATHNFTGKIVAVTGGGKGLGRALVRAFAEAGADVAFSFHESSRGAAEAAEALRGWGRRVHVARADARQQGAMAAFVDGAASELGGLDVLVNNVGV